MKTRFFNRLKDSILVLTNHNPGIDRQSLLFLDSVIENIPNMIFVKDAQDLRFVRFNKAGTELIGLPRKELIGRNDYDFFPKEQADFFTAKDRAVLASGEVADIPEEPLTTKNKGVRILHTKKLPLYDKNGEPIYLLGISEDITEKRQAEQQRVSLIKEQAARAEAEKYAQRQAFLSEAGSILVSSLDFKQTLKNMARLVVPRIADYCSIHAFGPSGTLSQFAVAHTNPAAEKLAGVLYQKYPPSVDAPFGPAAVVREGKGEYMSSIPEAMYQLNCKEPERKELLRALGFQSYICVPLKRGGTVTGALTLAMCTPTRSFSEVDRHLAEDLADRAAIAMDNARLYTEAQNLNRIKEEFLAMVSHELRTPLNVIQGNAEILRELVRDLQTRDLDQPVDAIYRNAKTQTQIVEDLLNSSAIMAGKIILQPVSFSPVEMVKLLLQTTRGFATAKDLHIEFKSDLAPVIVTLDLTRFQQILSNLLSNAMKFTPQGGHIFIDLEENQSSILLRVRDTGEGIEKDFIPVIFDRFRQEDGTMRRRHGGLGLGLSIVRQLAEIQGGSVAAESEGKGNGSTFTVVLPFKREIEIKALKETRPILIESALNGFRILLVEDDADTRSLIERILRRCGAVVSCVASAAMAFEVLQNESFNFIISDIGMPEEDGICFIRRVREWEKTSDRFIPAAALTAYTRPEDHDMTLSAGFQVHIGKPVQASALITAIVGLKKFERGYLRVKT